MGLFRDMRALRRQGKDAMKASGRRGGFRGMADLVSEANTTVAQAQDNARLLQEGTPAEATITSARETGMIVNHRHVVEVELQVRSAGGAPYPATVTTSLGMTAAPLATPGSVVVVRVDPTDPARVAIDWDATAARPSTD